MKEFPAILENLTKNSPVSSHYPTYSIIEAFQTQWLLNICNCFFFIDCRIMYCDFSQLFNKKKLETKDKAQELLVYCIIHFQHNDDE